MRIRNVGTLGGNLAHADPNQDPPVTLIALTRRSSWRGRTASGRSRSRSSSTTTTRRSSSRASCSRRSACRACRPERRLYKKFLPRTADDYATVAVSAVVSLTRAVSAAQNAAHRAGLGRLDPGPRPRGRSGPARPGPAGDDLATPPPRWRPRSTRSPTSAARPSTSATWPRSGPAARSSRRSRRRGAVGQRSERKVVAQAAGLCTGQRPVPPTVRRLIRWRSLSPPTAIRSRSWSGRFASWSCWPTSPAGGRDRRRGWGCTARRSSAC